MCLCAYCSLVAFIRECSGDLLYLQRAAVDDADLSACCPASASASVGRGGLFCLNFHEMKRYSKRTARERGADYPQVFSHKS